MRLTKIAASIFLLAVFSVSGLYAYASRDTAPTHPSLMEAALPSLIPVSDFYASTSAEWGYQPSHDGRMIAWYGVAWTKTVLRVKRTGEAESFLTLSGVNVDDFSWHPYKNELLVMAQERLWQIDPQKPSRSDWIDVTPRGFGYWRAVSTPNGPEDRLVVASNDRNPAFYDLYTVQQDGGDKQLLEKNKGETVAWWLDHENVPVLRADRLEDGETVFRIRQSPADPWHRLTEANARDILEILYAPQGDKPIYALSDRGRERVALVTIDPQTGKETLVADDPRVDVNAVMALGTDAVEPDVLIFEDGYPKFRALSRAGEVFLQLLLDGENPVDFNILGRSRDGRFVTVARSLREQSFEYFLYDLEKGEAVKIADYDFRRHKDALAETRPVSFKARDGLEIPALLMLPRGAEPKNLPTVVVVHGGPAAQDIWQYNHEYQFLANRGYAVLSVNFRGSIGYGKAFREAGYGEIGRAMQDDIVDAANWLVEQGIADKANMAVMGGSYGGYSAALAMTRDPGVFKAAIVEAPITDLVYDMETLPAVWDLHLDELKRYFPASDPDLEQMRQRSPLTHAADVQGAILITAGKQDRNVGVEQSEEFEKALKAAGKDVTAAYFEKEGHGYTRWQTKVKRVRLIEDFLARELGGRSGGFDYIELAAEYLD